MPAPVWPVTRARRIIPAPLAATKPVNHTPTATPARGLTRRAIPAPATPLAAPRAAAVLPISSAPLVSLPAVPLATVKVSPAALRDGAETRVKYLKGQVRQDCAALANSAVAISRRIERGEVPRQDGEFSIIAHRLDQDLASLFELLRLLTCYTGHTTIQED